MLLNLEIEIFKKPKYRKSHKIDVNKFDNLINELNNYYDVCIDKERDITYNKQYVGNHQITRSISFKIDIDYDDESILNNVIADLKTKLNIDRWLNYELYYRVYYDRYDKNIKNQLDENRKEIERLKQIIRDARKKINSPDMEDIQKEDYKILTEVGYILDDR